MKPIEYCLDRVLQELKNSYENVARPPLIVDPLMKEFEVPLGRHEFFKSLMEKLMNDGFAVWLEPPALALTINIPLDLYGSQIIPTVEGLYFIIDGGYTPASLEEQSKKRNCLSTSKAFN